MATPNFFIKSADPDVQACLNKRTWNVVKPHGAVSIKVNDTQYFPTDKSRAFDYNTPWDDPLQNTHLESVSVTDSGDYMTARKCEIRIKCSTLAAFERIEKDFGFIDANKKLFIKFWYSDPITTAEDTGYMEFRILEPSFTFNEKGEYMLTVKGIGAGSNLYNINMKDVAFMRMPNMEFVHDYAYINDTKPVENLPDFFEWTIQSQTGELTSSDFDPEAGSNGVIDGSFTEQGRWLTLRLSEEFYEADWQGVATRGVTLSPTSPSIRYVTLSGLVQTINKYFIPDATSGVKPMKIRCDKDITRVSMQYKTKDGSAYWIFSANPKLVIFPLNGDGWKGDYSAAGELQLEMQSGDRQVFEFSKIPAMAPLLQACDMTDGDVSGMLISTDLIRTIFQDSLQLQKNDTNNKKDVSKLSMDTFFRTLFDSVKELSGGAIDLKLLVNSDLTSPTETTYDVVNVKHTAEDKITPLVFARLDNNLKEFSIQSKITQDLITAAYGDMPGSKGDESATSAIVSTDNTAAEKEPEGLPAFAEIFDVKCKRLAGTGFSDEGVQAAIGVLKRLVSDQKPVEKLEHTSALYPIELSIKIHGTGGFKFGDCFTVKELPSRYRQAIGNARVIFTVYEVTHTYGKDPWATDIKGMMRLTTADKILDVTANTSLGPEPQTGATDTTGGTGTTGGGGGTGEGAKPKPKSRTRDEDLETT
jgi:hypothetical protein